MTLNLINLFQAIRDNKYRVELRGLQGGCEVVMTDPKGRKEGSYIDNDDLTELLNGYIKANKTNSIVFAARSTEDMQAKLDTFFAMHPNAQVISSMQSESILPPAQPGDHTIGYCSAFHTMTVTLIYTDKPIKKEMRIVTEAQFGRAKVPSKSDRLLDKVIPFLREFEEKVCTCDTMGGTFCPSGQLILDIEEHRGYGIEEADEDK